MNKRAILFLVGRIMWLEAVCMLPALLIALAGGDSSSAWSFAATIGALALLGVAPAFFKGALKDGLHAREGFIIVALGWVVISLFGALPFYFGGSFGSFIDCWFEAVSGITTTGASILHNVEIVPRALLYWRSFLNWLGGMGVLVFMLAVVPMTKGSGGTLFIMRAESPGPVVSKFVPKMRDNAIILYLIYITLTILMVGFLLLGGMPFFDSICHAFATAGTGGFSIKNASFAFYDSYYLQTVAGVFMVLFGVNFALYFMLFMRDFKNAFKSEELRLYLIIIAAAVGVIALNTGGLYTTVRDTVHHAFFQVSSIITTTGFSSVDFDLWPQLSKAVLLVLMVFGACAGSTGGGLKMARLLILGKSARYELKKMLHPRSVRVIKLDGRVLDDTAIKGVNGYFVLYSIIAALSFLIISCDTPDFTTSLSAVASCLNNIGPGLGEVGPSGNYAMLSGFSKFVLSMDMLIGRLEIYPMLLLFSPTAWARG